MVGTKERRDCPTCGKSALVLKSGELRSHEPPNGSETGRSPRAHWLCRGEEKPSVICDRCGKRHEAVYHHVGRFGEGRLYAVICPVGNPEMANDYYTREMVAGLGECE